LDVACRPICRSFIFYEEETSGNEAVMDLKDEKNLEGVDESLLDDEDDSDDEEGPRNETVMDLEDEDNTDDEGASDDVFVFISEFIKNTKQYCIINI
jgi:hypothetical protein